MIEITINGDSKTFDEPITVENLLIKLEIDKAGTAVALNDRVVPRSSHGSVIVDGGDRLEVIRAVGGG